MKPVAVHWFRNDLRVHDQPALVAARRRGDAIVGIYGYDAEPYGAGRFGFCKTGPHRARFRAEALADLRANLGERGIPLVVRDTAAEALSAVLGGVAVARLSYPTEPASEETAIERDVLRMARARAVRCEAYAGHSLLHPEDLPFAIAGLPDLFTTFRKEVERHWRVREVAPEPGRQELVANLPDVGTLRPAPNGAVSNAGSARFTGGETAGLARLQEYLWERDRLRVYKETRNGMLQFDDSSKLSPWLAAGCLSPRRIYAEIRRYERERVENDSTYWLIFELLWRDFFRLTHLKQGDRLFLRDGLQRLPIEWSRDPAMVAAWCEGKTGYPIVDANMRELSATGYMSNRGRQIVASFFTKNLGLDWRIGAEWFEHQLLDYDVASNYGNWQYAAGVGNDGREFRLFNLRRQAEMYDPKGDYVRYWIPELRRAMGFGAHEPWRSGADYVPRIVDFDASARENRARYEAAVRRAGGPSGTGRDRSGAGGGGKPNRHSRRR
ncbi:MAG: DASH family cryptochrome [Fimbriimonadaceae bacterium]|nr:DASH family cryptochrome [Fimbriimonadaceae bacterium]